MTASDYTVFLVDDDPGVLKAFSRVLRDEGLKVEAFESAEAYLARPTARRRRLPGARRDDAGLDGLELQKRLVEETSDADRLHHRRRRHPDDCAGAKAGASDFLAKPVPAETLVRAVRLAIEQDVSARRARDEPARMRERLAGLTPREREVLTLVASGHLNKQIAAALGVVERTVKFHRAQSWNAWRRRPSPSSCILQHVGIGASFKHPRAHCARRLKPKHSFRLARKRRNVP